MARQHLEIWLIFADGMAREAASGMALAQEIALKYAGRGQAVRIMNVTVPDRPETFDYRPDDACWIPEETYFRAAA